MTLLHAYQHTCQQRAQAGCLRQLPRSAHANTKIVADFSHNDYLGLSQHPQVLQAAHAALDTWGAGATGARLLSGNYALLNAFEREIATDKGTEAALIFVSGYQANATALAALLDPKILGNTPEVFSDRLNHASLHHACRLVGVRQQRYRHTDLNHLETLLKKSVAQQRHIPRFIISETVFGMEGDCVDVPALAALAERYQALLYLDDAHATGVWGERGYGLGASLGAHVGTNAGAQTVVMGTFSKALGASGAYLACAQPIVDYLLNTSSGFIYSTAPAPAAIAAARASWQMLPSLADTRQRLLAQAAALRARLQAAGLNTGTSRTHIVPIIFGDETLTLAMQKKLAALGIIVSAVRPPTVPPHTARLRIALSASHTPAHIDALLAGLGV